MRVFICIWQIVVWLSDLQGFIQGKMTNQYVLLWLVNWIEPCVVEIGCVNSCYVRFEALFVAREFWTRFGIERFCGTKKNTYWGATSIIPWFIPTAIKSDYEALVFVKLFAPPLSTYPPNILACMPFLISNTIETQFAHRAVCNISQSIYIACDKHECQQR